MPGFIRPAKVQGPGSECLADSSKRGEGVKGKELDVATWAMKNNNKKYTHSCLGDFIWG